MQSTPRCGLPFILVTAALCISPQWGRADGLTFPLDYASVGQVVSRVVDGRTVVVVPVAGRLRPRLSEPIRDGNRWRLDLTIEDARVSIGSRTRQTEGVASLTIAETGADVRITILVDKLGDYGARRSEEGMLLWIEPERRTPVVTDGMSVMPIGTSTASVQRVNVSPAEPAEKEGSNLTGLLFLGLLAASAGAGVRWVRRNGVPTWASQAVATVMPVVKVRLFGAEPHTAQGSEQESGMVATETQPYRHTAPDTRSSSAEIGDAFRVEPEQPASGIAALVAATDNDAE